MTGSFLANMFMFERYYCHYILDHRYSVGDSKEKNNGKRAVLLSEAIMQITWKRYSLEQIAVVMIVTRGGWKLSS